MNVDMAGAGAGASGAATAASGASAGTVTGEKKRAQEEAKRRKEKIQAALAQLGSGAANVPSNLEAPRKWHELREIQESIANKKTTGGSS